MGRHDHPIESTGSTRAVAKLAADLHLKLLTDELGLGWIVPATRTSRNGELVALPAASLRVAPFEALPDTWDLVAVKNRIRADQCQLFFQGLARQEAVEGITMMERETGNPGNVAERDIQLVDIVGPHLCR